MTEGKQSTAQGMIKRYMDQIRRNSASDVAPRNGTSQEDFFQKDEIPVISGNGKNSTPPYGLPALEKISDPIDPEGPATVVHESVIPADLKNHLVQMITSLTNDTTLLNSAFNKILDVDMTGGNPIGLVLPITLSTERRSDTVNISESSLSEFVIGRLSVDLTSLDEGIHNFFDGVGLIYQISIQREGVFSQKKSRSVSLGVLVPKI